MPPPKKPKTAKIGRPTIYSKAITSQICRLMAEGKSLRTICNREDMPTLSTVMDWLCDPEKAAFSEQYARAREQRADALFEEMQNISDDALIGEKIDEETSGTGFKRKVMIADNVQRADLMVRTRQWMLARMAPKKYGDKMQVESKVDITQHYTEDDVSALDRYVKMKIQEATATKRSKTNGKKHTA